MSDSKHLISEKKFKELFDTWCGKNISWKNFLNAYSEGVVREAKSHECPDCKSELEIGGLGALICKNESCGFCRQIYYEHFEKVKEK